MGKVIKATYFGATQNYSVFHIDPGQEFIGTLFVPNDRSAHFPVTIELKIKEEDEVETDQKATLSG